MHTSNVHSSCINGLESNEGWTDNYGRRASIWSPIYVVSNFDRSCFWGGLQLIFRMSCSFSLLAQRKRTKRKGTSAQGISAVRNQNPSAKAGPRLPSFLTLMVSYAEGRRTFDEWSNTLKIFNSTRLTSITNWLSAEVVISKPNQSWWARGKNCFLPCFKWRQGVIE